jgi:hypothetical protein
MRIEIKIKKYRELLNYYFMCSVRNLIIARFARK